MRPWEKIGEEASIVLVGNFNPSIFHPEWFIRHEIVPAWDYPNNSHSEDADLAILPDLAHVEFQDHRSLHVMLNKLTMRCSRASEYLTTKDIVTRTFGILRETPIAQMGMNHQSVIQLNNEESWLKFGEVMAPKKPWLDAALYVSELSEDKSKMLGLIEMTMQLPRPDKLIGYIRPTIKVLDPRTYKLLISINNHVEIEEKQAIKMIDYLDNYWEWSINFADKFIDMTLASQLNKESQHD
jgi:hypothetical protein